VRGRLADKQRELRGDPRAGLSPLSPAAPLWRFVPTPATDSRYRGWPSLGEVLPFHREGVQTNRDLAVVDVDRERLLSRLHAFAEGRDAPGLEVARRPLPHYDPERARERLAQALAAEGPEAVVRPLWYRPFDRRWFAAVSPLCHRPRAPLARAMAHSEVGLITVRKDRSPAPWAHFGAADALVDNCFLSTRSSCRARLFPSHGPDGEPNLDAAFGADLAERIQAPVQPAQVVRYALATLAAPAYRARFREALQQDYPRLPWPRDAADFAQRVELGARLEALLVGAEPLAVAGAQAPAAGQEPNLTLGHHRLDPRRAPVAALASLLAALPES
jgi:hypothetical protein